MTQLFNDCPDSPRVYRIPSGLAFAREFIAGLRHRLGDAPPETMARVVVLVSAQREVQILENLFQEDGAQFLPKIHSLRAISVRPELSFGGGVPIQPVRRTMALARLVEAYITKVNQQSPDGEAVFQLADNLAKLLGELHIEGVDPESLGRAVPDNLADHWESTARFLNIIGQEWPIYLTQHQLMDPDLCRVAATQALLDHWQHTPPAYPVIVAGSTATDSTTAKLVAAVADLPQGAVILPGLDVDLDEAAWQQIDAEDKPAPEHPQYSMKLLLNRLARDRHDVPGWTTAQPPRPERTRFLGQALRPAPATEAWRQQAADYDTIASAAMDNVELIEARSSNEEAATIALTIRACLAEDSHPVLFVTEDNDLRTRVLAKCRRWNITPDNWRGLVALNAPIGRYAMLVARVALGEPDLLATVALLKCNYCQYGRAHASHRRTLSQIERILRRQPGQQPGFNGIVNAIHEWRDAEENNDQRHQRAQDLLDHVERLRDRIGPLARFAGPERVQFAELVDGHLTAMAHLSGGSEDAAAHPEYVRLREELMEYGRHSDAYGDMTPSAYIGFVNGMLAALLLYHRRGDPRVLMWSTLEARFSPTRFVILGGLNEEVAPGEGRGEDPWLNRQMRAHIGLPPPERAIGRLAHDIAELFACEHVVLTRAQRVAGEPQLPSRWLLRLTNLLEGVGAEGRSALAGMRARGQDRLQLTRRMDSIVGPPTPIARPCPCPPVTVRPRQLSATQIETLLKDPYAIYARHILKLRQLEPLGAAPDARDRGTVIHQVLEAFTKAIGPGEVNRDRVTQNLDTALNQAFVDYAEWPWLVDLWQSGIEQIREWLVSTELERCDGGWRPTKPEQEGKLIIELPAGEFTITARADRIDRNAGENAAGLYRVYDYKTGSLPKAADLESHAWQIAIEALIAARGGFDDLPMGEVDSAAYIGLKPDGGEGRGRTLSVAVDPDETMANLIASLSPYDHAETPYISHAMRSALTYGGQYDHLARVAEWSIPTAEFSDDD